MVFVSLHSAVLSGSLECVKLVLEKSIRRVDFDVETKRKLMTSPLLYRMDKFKRKPFDLAVIKGHGLIALYLCQKEMELVNEDDLEKPLEVCFFF